MKSSVKAYEPDLSSCAGPPYFWLVLSEKDALQMQQLSWLPTHIKADLDRMIRLAQTESGQIRATEAIGQADG